MIYDKADLIKDMGYVICGIIFYGLGILHYKIYWSKIGKTYFCRRCEQKIPYLNKKHKCQKNGLK